MSGNNLDFHGKLDQVDWVKEKIVAEFKSELTNLETEVANSTLEAALKSQDSAALETAANNVLQKCLDDMKVEHMTFKMMIEKRWAAYVLALQIKLKLSWQNPWSLDGMRAGDTRKAVEARQIAYNTANPTAIIKADWRAGKNTLPLIINSSVIANPAAAPASGAEVNENAPDITEMIEWKHYEIKNGVFTLLVEPKTLQKVTYLNVVSKNITDISALKGLTGLTDLSLSGNNITDISALKEMTGLTNLSLRANNITDISALKGLTGLTELDLEEVCEEITSLISQHLKGWRDWLILVCEQITSLISQHWKGWRGWLSLICEEVCEEITSLISQHWKGWRDWLILVCEEITSLISQHLKGWRGWLILVCEQITSLISQHWKGWRGWLILICEEITSLILQHLEGWRDWLILVWEEIISLIFLHCRN
jgi:hypothetical protein